jgi:ribosomal protein L31E
MLTLPEDSDVRMDDEIDQHAWRVWISRPGSKVRFKVRSGRKLETNFIDNGREPAERQR